MTVKFPIKNRGNLNMELGKVQYDKTYSFYCCVLKYVTMFLVLKKNKELFLS